MKSIEDILKIGGTIDVPRGFLKCAYELSDLGEPVARLTWEDAPPGKAYFDTASHRYVLEIVARSHLTRRRTIQACRGGEVVAELHAGWRGSDGDAITSAGRRYVFGKTRGCYVVEREVGHERVCEVSRRYLRRGREIRVRASQSPEDVVGVLAVLVFHILAIDYESDRSTLAAGGFAAGG